MCESKEQCHSATKGTNEHNELTKTMATGTEYIPVQSKQENRNKKGKWT